MGKLNQVLAVEKGVKTRVYGELTQIDKGLQKAELLSGISRTYTPKEDDGQQLPPESKNVQATVAGAMELLMGTVPEWYDITATKDWANQSAKANIVVDETVLLADVPPTFLLFLEKQLTDLRTMISRLPVLDPADRWTWSDNSAAWTTEPSESLRTVKVPKAFVKYDATPEHPAQVDVFHEDVVAGTWRTMKFSGAIPASDRLAMMDRAEKLLNAVKVAREEANSMEVEQRTVGATLLSYVFGTQASG